MSGSPKFSKAKIAEYKEKIIEAERQKRAEAEARRRQEAEEKERRRLLDLSRSEVEGQLETLRSHLDRQQQNLYQKDAVTFQQQTANQEAAIANASSESDLLAISEDLLQIEKSLQAALDRKRRQEAENIRKTEMARRQFELEELERRVANIPEAEALKYDAAGREQLRGFFQKVRGAIAAEDPVAIGRPLAEATAFVEKHRRQIARGQAESQGLQAEANRLLTELQTIAAGLKADPVVMRWQLGATMELEKQMNGAKEAIARGKFEPVISILKEARERSQTIIETANTAQIQADKRDYITDSIAETLQEMGFDIIFEQPEYPDHPASATILGATSQAGKGISVSIPIAGEVLYDVNGYIEESATTVDGNTVRVCDEAEEVLTEMHSVLENKYGVEMGEVFWEGKEPNRRLAQAEHLPREKGASGGAVSRSRHPSI